MLRALLARLGLTGGGADQLELGLGDDPARGGVDPGAPPRRRPGRPSYGPSRGEPGAERDGGAAGARGRRRGNGTSRDAVMTEAARGDAMLLSGGGPQSRPHAPPAPLPAALLDRLRSFGMEGITSLRLTRNRTTLVSFRAGTLRIQEGFADAPDHVLRAIAVFVSARGAARQAARRIIVAHPLARDAVARPPRRTPLHPDDHGMAERLQREHARLNALHFGGALRPIRVTVSRRMTSRLGHYAPARSHPAGAEIAISRRHIRRHGWQEALDTLLHEMVHQWQEESGHPIDHGAAFRRKAHEVGTTPRARRVLR